MTDIDAEIEASRDQPEAAGMVESVTDHDGQDEPMAALLEDAEG